MSVVSEAHDQGPQPVPRYLDRLNGRDNRSLRAVWLHGLRPHGPQSASLYRNVRNTKHPPQGAFRITKAQASGSE